MSVSRRTFLAGGTAAGALLVGGGGALAAPLGGVAAGPSRASRLFPGTRLAHADLHNHTLYSDGAGDPALAFASMRDAGLDVAALTDHATVAKALPAQAAELACTGPEGCGLVGIDEGKWQASRGLADETNRDGSFASIRGFEWSSPTLGHMNVWFSETWIDPASTGGSTTGEGLAQFAHDVPGLGPAISGPLDEAVRALPSTGTGMALFHDWLAADPSRPVLGGGGDAIFGFNHPGREPGRFGYFSYDERLQQRLVSLEVFNRGEDYLFEGTDAGFASPIPECLDAGWKVGLLGVTDEHGTDWGYPDGKGRTGLWVKALTRAGVREAMEARRFFSTRLRGLRVDASLNGARMGSTVGFRSGAATFALDLDRGPAFYGRKLVVQVLQTGRPLPTVVAQRTVTVPRPSQPVVRFTVPLDVSDGRWVVLRICDPSQKADGRATTAAYTTAGNAIAYTAPFFLDPDRAAAPAPAPGSGSPVAAEPRPVVAPGVTLPSTGGAPGTAVGAAALVAAAAALRSGALRSAARPAGPGAG